MNTPSLPENPTVEQERDYYKSLYNEMKSDLTTAMSTVKEVLNILGIKKLDASILGKVPMMIPTLMMNQQKLKALGPQIELLISKYGGTQ